MRIAAALLALLATAGCTATPDALEIERGVLEWGDREQAISLPSHLDVPDEDLEYAVRMDVELPDALRGRALDLRIARLPARARAEADGLALDDISPPLIEGYRIETPRAFRVPAGATDDGHVSLRVTVEHRWTRSAWWDTPPVLMPAGARHARSEVGRVLDLVLAGAGFFALWQIGISCVLVYLVDRRRKAYLWFGIQGLTASYYPLHQLGVTQLVLGRADVAGLAATLSIAPLVSVWFTHEFFGLREPGVGWRATLAVAVVVPIVASSPYLTTAVAGPLTVAVIAVVCAYQLFTCARLARSAADRTSAALLFTCWAVLTLCASPDLALWVGLGAPLGAVHGGSLGLAGFAFFLSLLLSRSHSVSIEHADALNAELGQRVAQLETRGREIEALNAELRRQIGDRSAQIYAALALLERGAAGVPQLRVGELVQDRYRVVRAIGAGGMGSVYEVERVEDGRRLALKLTRDLGGGSLARLAREARVAAQIHHPNVVGIVDVDVASAGFLFLVMELVEGPTLRDAMRAREGTPDARWALGVLAQVARGLEALHAAGIVHRDLKPANVILTGDRARPRAKIADFGISRWAPVLASTPHAEIDGSAISLVLPIDETKTRVDTQRRRALDAQGRELAAEGSATQRVLAPRAPADVSQHTPSGPSSDEGPSLTETGLLPGTPLYIAPELTRGSDALAPASDMFAFGVVAYELLTGTRPYEEPVAILEVQGKPIPPPRSLGPLWRDGARDVVVLLEACVATSPEARPSAGEVAETLERASAGGVTPA